MRRIAIFFALTATTAFAQDHGASHDAAKHETSGHETSGRGSSGHETGAREAGGPEAGGRDDAAHGHAPSEHGAHVHDQHAADMPANDQPAIAKTTDIDAALAAGGQPVVADVLGVVCDFCAKAMNKTFGKRDEVAAVYVDLDDKTLNLVLEENASLTDDQINKLVKKAGYRTASIRRGDAALNGGR